MNASEELCDSRSLQNELGIFELLFRVHPADRHPDCTACHCSADSVKHDFVDQGLGYGRRNQSRAGKYTQINHSLCKKFNSLLSGRITQIFLH